LIKGLVKEFIPPYHWQAKKAAIADVTGLSQGNAGKTVKHLDAAIRWLCAAHDATGRCGAARMYSLKKGWGAAYPETTGYIIPTFFDYAEKYDKPEIREHAVRMADWESEIQLPDGGVMAGIIGATPIVPTIFNTGQVIFGWIRAYRETGTEKYLDCAVRAGDFLVKAMDDDGEWRRYGSIAVDTEGINRYNTRVACSLLRVFAETGDEKYKKAAIKNIEASVAAQHENGWYPNNCLTDVDRPLVHTIAYATRGMLETGLFLEEEKYMYAARKTADALLKVQKIDHSLAGRYDKDWRPAVHWSCLTGNAQTAIIWFKLYKLIEDEKYLKASKNIIKFLKRTQNLKAKNPGVYGGIKGSFPVFGQYGPYEYLNWAAKFFADALMLHLELVEKE
jgi:beta-L-arabinofuranosidase (glycosyl hydrolase family 127)